MTPLISAICDSMIGDMMIIVSLVQKAKIKTRGLSPAFVKIVQREQQHTPNVKNPTMAYAEAAV